MNNVKEGFPPIADESAVVLILGSMPGEASLRQQQYYAHPQNTFWRIIAALFDLDSDSEYRKRTKYLRQNSIALWDVMQTCERTGSLDSAIVAKTIIENDFESFFIDHPHIRHVFFNGAKAQSEYCKRVLPTLPNALAGIVHTRLPSTSPAMAILSFDEKLAQWSIVKEAVEQLRQKEKTRE